jgi:hypothetical protein
LEVTVTLSVTLAKPAFFAYEDGRRSFARDLGGVGVLAPAGICAATVTESTTAAARAAKVSRLIARVRKGDFNVPRCGVAFAGYEPSGIRS